ALTRQSVAPRLIPKSRGPNPTEKTSTRTPKNRAAIKCPHSWTRIITPKTSTMPIIVFIPSPYLALSFYATPNPLPNSAPGLVPICNPAGCPRFAFLPGSWVSYLGMRVPQVRFFTWVLGFSPLPVAQSLLTVLLGLSFTLILCHLFSSLLCELSALCELCVIFFSPPTPTSPPLPAPLSVPLHPPRARPPYSQTSPSASGSTPAQSLPVSPKTPASSPKTPPPPPHPPHSARRATPRPSLVPPAPGASTETYAWTPSQNPASSTSSSPAPPDWMPPYPGRLTHTESACAYPAAPFAPAPNHPQIPPSNESWTAGAPPPQSGPGAPQTASAPQSPQILCSSSSPNQS